MTRILAAVLLAAVVLGLGAGLGRLETRFNPAGLVYGEAARTQEQPAIYRLPWDTASTASVERVAAFSARLEGEGARVISPTNVPLPHLGEGDLEATLALIEAAPDHFPRGLIGLGERTGGELVVGPVVEGVVGEDERLALESAAPELEGSLLSADRTRALVVAFDLPPERAVELAQEEGLVVTGLAVLEEQLESRLHDEALQLLLCALLLQALFLAFLFRRADALGLPLMAAGIALFITMGCAGWLAIPLSLLTAIVPPVLLTIAVGDALHVLIRFSYESQRGPGAAARTRAHMFRACLATSLTTAAGFLSLCFAQTPAVRTFGLLTVFGVGVAFVVVIALVPFLLRWSPPAPPAWARLAHSRRVAELAVRARRHRFGVAVLTLLLVGLCAQVAPDVAVGTRLLSPFATGDPAAELAREIDADFGGIRRMEWSLEGGLDEASLRRVRELCDLAEAHGARVRGSARVLDAAWARFSSEPLPEQAIAPLAALSAPALRALVSEGHHRIVLTLPDQPASSLAALGRLAEGQGAEVSGEAWHAGVGLAQLQADLAGTLGLAFASIFLVVGLLFGVRAIASALVPNLLPLLLIVAYMALRGIPIDVSSAMVFAVTLGLVVDGTLHLLSAHRESGDLHTAYARSGGAVLWGGVLLALGFGALMLSSLVPLQRFAELALVAIGSGTLAELLILPALLPKDREPATDAP